MALSIDAIYQPLNAFFLQKFETGAGSPVLFRFDKFGSVISEQDFIDPDHPAAGYNRFRATEKFSELVNQVPADAGDGMSIVFRQSTVDDTYFYRLLSPSLPYVTTNTPNADSVIADFSTIKADALKVWRNLTVESSSGLMLQYKPSIAEPDRWFDQAAADLWTAQHFSVSAPTTSVPTAPATQQMWRMKLDNAVLADTLQATPSLVPTSELNTLLQPDVRAQLDIAPQPVAEERAPVLIQRAMLFHQAEPAVLERSTVESSATVSLSRPSLLMASLSPMLAVQPRFGLQDQIARRMPEVNISNRLALAQLIGSIAPTAPTSTDNITISFEYCLIKIHRPWYKAVLMDGTNWYVPTVARGGISPGAGINATPFITVALVAIRNLVIDANWAATDLSNASNATDFGPFKITSGIVSNQISHKGIQVIGWMLQTLPALPPNNPPSVPAAPDPVPAAADPSPATPDPAPATPDPEPVTQ